MFAETGVPRPDQPSAPQAPVAHVGSHAAAAPSAAAVDGSKCGSCGAINPSGKFCSSCGNILNRATAPAVSAPSQPAFSQVAAPPFKAAAAAPVSAAPAGDKCGTCGKTVYFAEKLMGPGNRVYHKMCFKCSECRKMLDAGNCSDKDGVVFCKGLLCTKYYIYYFLE